MSRSVYIAKRCIYSSLGRWAVGGVGAVASLAFRWFDPAESFGAILRCAAALVEFMLR